MPVILRQVTVRHCVAGAVVVSLACGVAGCGLFSSGKGGKIDPKYGVAPSPRVASGRNIPSGGGRYHVGNSYKIGSKWFHPREDKNYNKVGTASWYGKAFHGRRTANGVPPVS